MKFKVWSDLHIEGNVFNYEPKPEDKDLTLILAGDIGTIIGGLEPFLIEQCNNFENVIFVHGNHEFYNDTLDVVKTKINILSSLEKNLFVLDNDQIIIDNVRILGTPMWTNFGYNPDLIKQVGNMIRDYSVTRILDGFILKDGYTQSNIRKLVPEDHKLWNEQALVWLKHKLATPFNGKTIVITHWSPTNKLTEERFKGEMLNYYFCNDCEYLMHSYDIDTWIYGHTHGKIFVDYDEMEEFNGVRLINNPRGYSFEDSLNQFDKEKQFEPDRIFEVK